MNKEGTVVSDADIHFSVHRDGVTTYAGTIYISRDKESNSAYPLYTATIVGTGLHLAQNTENEGGVISAVSTSAVDDEAKKYYLIIGADGVKSIELTMPNSSGGRENADGSLFKKGERIWLENLDGYNDLRGLMITAIGENGEIIWTASIPNSEENKGFTHLTQDDWIITPIE